MTDTLVLEGLHVAVGDVKILQGISARLLPGELCALIGPSGAGKSTLMRVLLGLMEPTSGHARLPASESDGAPGVVGYVPQDDAVHRTLKVRAALDYSLQLRAPALDAESRSARVEEVAGQVGLTERLDVRIKKLSGGQRKRVSVALELLTQPPVLILDEPTSGLDPGLEARAMQLFREVADSGCTVLVATHAMQSLELCDVLMVLTEGSLAWCGPPAQALEWFRAESFEAIFEQLPKRPGSAWQRAWLASAERGAFDKARSERVQGSAG